VIFTGFLLDLFQPQPLQHLLETLFRHLNPGGHWLLADFQPETATVFWQKSLLILMDRVFKITANLQASHLPDLENAIQKIPVKQLQEQYFYHQLIRSAVYQKLPA